MQSRDWHSIWKKYATPEGMSFFDRPASGNRSGRVSVQDLCATMPMVWTWLPVATQITVAHVLPVSRNQCCRTKPCTTPLETETMQRDFCRCREDKLLDWALDQQYLFSTLLYSLAAADNVKTLQRLPLHDQDRVNVLIAAVTWGSEKILEWLHPAQKPNLQIGEMIVCIERAVLQRPHILVRFFCISELACSLDYIAQIAVEKAMVKNRPEILHMLLFQFFPHLSSPGLVAH